MVRKSLTGREKFNRYSLIIKLSINTFRLVPRPINKFLYKLVQNVDFNFGMFFRYVLIKNIIKECGENVSIHPYVFIKSFENISLGNNLSIHRWCYIDGTGDISIGDNVSIAHSTSLISFEHSYNDMDLPIKYNPIIKNKISIQSDVWIGAGCRILSGVNIGNRSIIAAGCVVNKNVPDHTLVGGVPMRVIKNI